MKIIIKGNGIITFLKIILIRYEYLFNLNVLARFCLLPLKSLRDNFKTIKSRMLFD